MKQKIIIILFAISLGSLFSQGQTIEDIGLITIGVGYPDNANEETAHYFDRLSKKMTKAITNMGCASYADCQFLCIPEIDIESIDVAEGGMKNVYVFNGTITITALDKITGNIFNSFSDVINGHATTKEKAIANAINEAKLKNFNAGLEGLKEKICDYYKKNKEVMFNQAQSMADQGFFDEAIALLMDFPSVILPDYYECLGLANDIYDRKLAELERQRIAAQRDRNSSTLTKASNAIAASYPEEALQILMEYETGIDDQDNEYVKLRKMAQSKISQEKQLEYERQERAYRDARADKDRDYELAHKRIDTHAQIENRKISANQQVANKRLDVAREQSKATERIENRRIDAASSIIREQTQAAERLESKRIDAIKKVALTVKKIDN